MELIKTTNNEIAALQNFNITEVCNDFLSFYKDRQPTTIQGYTKNLRVFITWLRDNEIVRPQREDIISFRDDLKAKGLKSGTINTYLNSLRQFFKWLTMEDYYTKNPYQNIRGLKTERDSFAKDYLTESQVIKVLSQFKGDTPKSKRDFAILFLAFTTGMRTIELERANIGDLTTLGGCDILYYQAKGYNDKNKYKKLAREVKAALDQYLETRPDKDNPEAPLFTSESSNHVGHRLDKRSVSRMIKTTFRKVGLDSDRITAHSCRHTCATLNLQNGGTLEETRELLGHSNINTTLIYSHIINRDKNNSEQRIANAILGALK